MRAARSLQVSGIVQGVGFRPFVYRQAVRWSLCGWVLNASDGVHIHLEGEEAALEGFLGELTDRAPLAAMLTSVEVEEASLEGFEEFTIRPSQELSQADTLVSPDIATCALCREELFDPKNQRYHYPFINCTNCGPRFTIIDGLPYDRPQTSMADFEMCTACEGEYHNPLDRRFHAQPNACFDCGPTLQLWRSDTDYVIGFDQPSSDDLIAEVVALLEAGGIVAIKGLGGYHLACDATNEEAVATLRRRKRRVAKPFALMVRDLSMAMTLCQVSYREASLLTGSVRPIVLLERKPASQQAPLAFSVAGNLHELGIMLPATPVQHLLMALVDRPLVMTSGNIREEPIISAEQEAHELLGSVADAFLDNNRAILSRYDDSVVRAISERVFMVRRARGYAPRPIPFPFSSHDKDRADILATGPEQKATFCLTRGRQAFVSQHLGDLESASAFSAWLKTLGLYQRLFDLTYQVVVSDMHPEYLSTKWARAQQEARMEVQHHHAHIAAVLAEQQALGAAGDAGDSALIGRVIGIAFDGTGFGEDETIWGGEALIASLAGFERFAHLRCVPLVGGPAAIKHPARMAWSYLRSLGLAAHEGAGALVARVGEDRLLLLDQIIAGRINSPLTSSIGRLFDAVSALIGICYESNYEGQAAVELEAALYDPSTGEPVVDPSPVESAQRYRFELDDAGGQGDRVFDPTPVLAALLDDLFAGANPALLSLRFHNAVVELIAQLSDAARSQTGLSTVALGGGVFMNRYLLTKVLPLLRSEGFTVLLSRDLPANDGCISYGQAAVAAEQMAELADFGIMLGS
ncbi:MAG: carbamoyltransferase HypF [Coriobacteriia bacterium]|nr:carbamoyltransferase HypF [Coriobacteriia bacterium]